MKNGWSGNSRISTSSPIGKALLGKQVGDEAKVQSPGGVRNLEVNVGASSTEILFSKPNPEILERIEINAGAARVRAKGLGNANFERLTFEGGVGFYTLDFRGRLEREADVDISMGVAQLTMLIPEEVGPQIKKETPLSAFWADGFEKENGYYVNDNFGRTKGTLTITVEGGLGSINVETVEGF